MNQRSIRVKASKLNYQTDTLPQLSQFFENDPDAKAFLLTGSLADPEVEVDRWSDIDVTVILADEAVARYAQSLAWLHPFGRLIGAERHESQFAQTVRVCLEGFKRFDFVFVPESALARDYLLLQMIRRDREKQTHIHRRGEWGNELVHGFACDAAENAPLAILHLIAHSCETFDELALQIVPNYVTRAPLVWPSIEAARNSNGWE